jgi:hypothetical protein
MSQKMILFITTAVKTSNPLLNELHGVRSQKMILFITTAVKTSNPLRSMVEYYTPQWKRHISSPPKCPKNHSASYLLGSNDENEVNIATSVNKPCFSWN